MCSLGGIAVSGVAGIRPPGLPFAQLTAPDCPHRGEIESHGPRQGNITGWGTVSATPRGQKAHRNAQTGRSMYIVVVALTMLVLPLVSIAIDFGSHPGALAVVLVGRWFVFWGVGVRLGLAGMRQLFRPSFTAKELFPHDQ